MTNGTLRKPSVIPMDENIKAFLQTKINSFIKWDLVRFFHDTPHAKDTAKNIATYIGRDFETVEHELEALVESHILAVERVSKMAVYYLTEDEATRDLIHRFMEACHDRNFRVKVINQVIQAMQFSPRHDF
jgi:DNA-binding transcriptional ArsR family regulator